MTTRIDIGYNPAMMTKFRLDPPISQCLTLPEIAERLGISDQTLYDLRDRWEDFPQPLKRIGNADVYYQPEVEWFHYEHGYGYGPESPRVGRRGMSRG